MGLKFAAEDFMSCYNEASELLQLHWEEIARNKQVLTINPDLATYKKLDKDMLLVTARSDGKLVGYFLWFLHYHLHYRHVLVAEEDLHFLSPEFRTGMNGYALLKAARNCAVAAGAKLLAMREKIGHEHAPILKRLGFNPTDIVYTSLVE